MSNETIQPAPSLITSVVFVHANNKPHHLNTPALASLDVPFKVDLMV